MTPTHKRAPGGGRKPDSHRTPMYMKIDTDILEAITRLALDEGVDRPSWIRRTLKQAVERALRPVEATKNESA